MAGLALNIGETLWKGLSPHAAPQRDAHQSIKRQFSQSQDPNAVNYQSYLDELLDMSPRKFVEKYIEYVRAGKLDPHKNPLKLYSDKIAGADLGNLNFTGIPLKGMVFQNCNLYNTKFDGCDLAGAKFINCQLDNASFEYVRGGEMLISGGSAHGAKFNFARMPNATIKNLGTSGNEAANADWSGMTMMDVTFENLQARSLKLSGLTSGGHVSFLNCKLVGLITDMETRKGITIDGTPLDHVSGIMPELLPEQRAQKAAANHNLPFDPSLILQTNGPMPSRGRAKFDDDFGLNTFAPRFG